MKVSLNWLNELVDLSDIEVERNQILKLKELLMN